MKKKPAKRPMKRAAKVTVCARRRYQRFREKICFCDYCESSFTLKQNVQTHIFLFHMGKNPTPLQRGRRCQTSLSSNPVKMHKVVQRSGGRPHVCVHCSKCFGTKTELDDHITIDHLKQRPFVCDQCEADFGRKSGLRRHILMVHTNLTYKCPFSRCSHPGYKCRKALNAHIRGFHLKIRPFVCCECGKDFVRRSDLNTHSDTHRRPLSLAQLGHNTCPYSDISD